VPEGASRFLHALAPMIVMTVALTTFAVIPWTGDVEILGKTVRLQVADLNFGILFILAISSLNVYGIALAGWSSNNKYSLLGGLRSAAQMISYEIAMALALVALIMIYGTVKLNEMVTAQSGGLFAWGVFKAPLSFFLFMIATYAETNRVPFDLVEADSEIVAGFHTEYSSLRFGLFYMGEYVHMAVSAALTAILFFGGYHIPWAHALLGPSAYVRLFPWMILLVAGLLLLLAWDVNRPKRKLFTKGNAIFAVVFLGLGVFLLALALAHWLFGVEGAYPTIEALCALCTQLGVLVVKFLFFFWLFIWVRWTVPRFRYDQLMHLGWKVLLPLAIVNIALCGALSLAGWL
jgi:NADH-quinone oxidoreductase subunit H